MTFSELASGFLQSFGIVAVVAFAYSAALACGAGTRCRRIAVPLIFGIGTAATMWVPVTLAPGLLFDMRHAFIILSALFGGWPSLALTTAVSLSMRVWQGGAGETAGVLGIAISSAVGFCAIHLLRERPLRLRQLAIMGLMASLSIFSILVLPWTTVLLVVENIVGPNIVANFVGVFLTGHILETQRARHESLERLTTEALVDPLTGLANRRSFDSNGPMLLHKVAAAGGSYAMMIIDIDHFKRVNDLFGHDAGDHALRHIASIIERNVRQGDLVARYGGEEMALVMLDRKPDEAQAAADRIRSAIASSPAHYQGHRIPLTVSIGLHTPSDVNESFWRVFQWADRALYKAKQNGRDRVELAVAA